MKRYFARTYVELIGAAGTVATALAVWQAITQSTPGLLLAAAPWAVAIALIAGSKVAPSSVVARTGKHPWAAYSASTIATVGAFIVDPVAGVVAGLGLAALLGYTLWYSRQHVPTAVATVGDPLPVFDLTTVNGERVTSEVFTGDPHVIMFYRGNWCPFCVAQVKGIAAQYRELEARGVRVALISPQRADDTEELSRRFDARMDFYVDVDGAAARTLDLVQEGGTPVTFGGGTNGDTVVPTVIITRADGTVAWIHHATDHRVRPEPSLFLEVIDREGIAIARRGA